MSIENRFNQAIDQDKELEESLEMFMDASKELGKEIASRGVAGESLSAVEKRFITTHAVLMLRGLALSGIKDGDQV